MRKLSVGFFLQKQLKKINWDKKVKHAFYYGIKTFKKAL